MTPAKLRRLTADYEEVTKNFAGHPNIIVTPAEGEPPEQYHVTYFVNGIYLAPDKSVQTLNRHEVEIILHADYPRYKPICRILTPIWHPNFKDGQICIGDIWGAGESLSDIIVNIGDMIQYKSWNSFSPLSSEAAEWAIKNKHLFPVGNIDLFYADSSSADDVEIDLFDEESGRSTGQDEVPAAVLLAQSVRQSDAPAVVLTKPSQPAEEEAAPKVTLAKSSPVREDSGNDFEITAEELEGIEFVPTAQRMQTVAHGGFVRSKINFRTILVKGLLWALIGAFLGFGVSEISGVNDCGDFFARMMGYSHLSEYMKTSDKANDELDKVFKEFKKYCKDHHLDPDDSDVLGEWVEKHASDEANEHINNYETYSYQSRDALYDSYLYEFNSDMDALTNKVKGLTRITSALWAAVIALFVGLSLGIGEGVYYGSVEHAARFGAIGAGISLGIGFLSGYLAQWMYSALLGDDPSLFVSSLIRGFGWAIMGIGIGLSIGIIKPELKRILFCLIGGVVGAFIGGFLFNYICEVIPYDTVARFFGILIMGGLIGVGVGLLEQFAKQAWLKVIRGEFEGKEYLVFAGTTSIGNNGKNTIVLFKDKLVGPHHCDIILQGSHYVLVDCGTPMGTVVNGNRISRHMLRKGDAIAVGNSVLIFNTK
jgi:Ubiquitin-protein ligase